ncbi:MAG: M50 family metallopeptidase [Bacillus sp. (in: Bacteria)]|nr:M50 family metallopeptidase [Bacillus sp. (in: firmicutes)]
MNTPMLVLFYVAIAAVGSRIPFLRVYLAHCNTLVFEVISVCIEGGKTNKIKLYKDGSGQTTNNVNSPFKKNLIAYVGYTGTSIAAIGLFYLVSKGNYHFVLYLFIGLLVSSLLLWIRSLFGFVWGLSFVLLLAVPIYFRNDLAIKHISIFLAAVLFTQSILNALQVCKQSLLSRENPDRKVALVQAKFFPVIIIGFALLSQSLYAGYFIIKTFLS